MSTIKKLLSIYLKTSGGGTVAIFENMYKLVKQVDCGNIKNRTHLEEKPR